jgi:hypothetical protein
MSLSSVKPDRLLGICISEGVETCLAGRQMGLAPVWSVVSTSGIAKFPVLPGIEGFHLLRENDANDASRKAIEACAQRWHEAGRSVVITDPDGGCKDLNEELLREARP